MENPRTCLETTGHAEKDAPCCYICGRELDLLTAQASEDPADSIYICFEYLKQKAFVYGKYTGGRYGAMRLSKYFTRQDCENKTCDDYIRTALDRNNDSEYSRLITCEKGQMEAVVLTKNTIQLRKDDMHADERLAGFFKRADEKKKYFCHSHAAGRNYICICGEELIGVGSERHRDLAGMNDQDFIGAFLPGVLRL